MGFKKRTDRTETLLKISYSKYDCHDDSCTIAFAENISATGVFIATHTPMKPGTVLFMEFTPHGRTELIRLKGMVMWTREDHQSVKGRKGMGVKFLGVTPENKIKLQQIVDTFEKANNKAKTT
jgi:uncharacterized protein (TIGR02266 family)